MKHVFYFIFFFFHKTAFYRVYFITIYRSILLGAA